MENFIRGHDHFKVRPRRHEQVSHLRLESAQDVRETKRDFAAAELGLDQRKRQRGLHPRGDVIGADAEILRGASFKHRRKTELHDLARGSLLVAAASEGRRSCRRRSAERDAIAKWLRRRWC